MPLEFVDAVDYDKISQGDKLEFKGLKASIKKGENVILKNMSKGTEIELTYTLSDRQREVLLAGGVINYFKMK